jgi:hypothetical protein
MTKLAQMRTRFMTIRVTYKDSDNNICEYVETEYIYDTDSFKESVFSILRADNSKILNYVLDTATDDELFDYIFAELEENDETVRTLFNLIMTDERYLRQ